MQQVAGREIGEHQADARLQRDVAERVEELVAGEVGPGQRAPVVADVHEARSSAAMRDVAAAARSVERGMRGDEERVGAAHERGGRGTQARLASGIGGRRWRRRSRQHFAALDVLGAVAEALRDMQDEAALVDRHDAPVGAVAAARRQLDAEQAERRAGLQRIGQRVVARRQRVDAQAGGVRRADEAGAGPGEHRGPRLPRAIGGSEQDERQQRKELAMLLGHRRAHDARADLRHALARAGARLHGLLAAMERRTVVRGRHRWMSHAASPTRLTGIATKPGSASTRASHARSDAYASSETMPSGACAV